VFTSFFFGLIHVDPCQGTMAMLMGLWLHYTYLMTRSLYVSMLLHFLNNTLSVLIPRWEQAEALDRLMTEQMPLGPTVAGLALLLLVGWALYQSRARLKNYWGGQTDLPAVESPPAYTGQTVVSPPLSWPALAAVVAGLAAFGLLLARELGL